MGCLVGDEDHIEPTLGIPTKKIQRRVPILPKIGPIRLMSQARPITSLIIPTMIDRTNLSEHTIVAYRYRKEFEWTESIKKLKPIQTSLDIAPIIDWMFETAFVYRQ